MKQARVMAAGASFAAAALASGVVASSVGASAGVASLRFYERPGPTHVVDNAPRGKTRTAGDVVLYANPVFDRHGTRVGTDQGICTMINARQSQCDATLALPKGQLVTHGLQGVGSGYEVAVLGGTGAYAGAKGTMTSHPFKDGGATILISLM